MGDEFDIASAMSDLGDTPDIPQDDAPVDIESGDDSTVDVSIGDEDVTYSPIFGNLSSPQMSIDPNLKSLTLQQGEDEGLSVDKVSSWLKNNKELAAVLISTGGGILSNISKNESEKETRDWLEKQDEKKWDRQQTARKYGTIKKTNTGLLGAIQNRSQA